MSQLVTKIYGIYDPEEPLIKYVGKTSLSLKTRYNQHLSSARTGRIKTPAALWIKSILELKRKPLIVLLDTVRGYGSTEERHWISCFENVLNIHPGGNGGHLGHTAFPQEWITKLGVWPDKKLADSIGRSREYVNYHRRKHGFARVKRFTTYKTDSCERILHNFTEEAANLLGSDTDKVIAKKLGMSEAAVRMRRIRLGIKSFTKCS